MGQFHPWKGCALDYQEVLAGRKSHLKPPGEKQALPQSGLPRLPARWACRLPISDLDTGQNCNGQYAAAKGEGNGHCDF